jgi:hypothetical protein
MEATIIEVPDMNDSFSRIVLSGKAYMIRFTYNDNGDYWTFGIYDTQQNPIAAGIKIVPDFPLNIFSIVEGMPFGVFMIQTKLNRIERYDFRDGKAAFLYAGVGE